MKQPDLLKLEKKIDLLNDKVDRLMEALNIELAKPPDIIQLEEEKTRKARERQQSEILAKENSKRRPKEELNSLRRIWICTFRMAFNYKDNSIY